MTDFGIHIHIAKPSVSCHRKVKTTSIYIDKTAIYRHINNLHIGKFIRDKGYLHLYRQFLRSIGQYLKPYQFYTIILHRSQITKLQFVSNNLNIWAFDRKQHPQARPRT